MKVKFPPTIALSGPLAKLLLLIPNAFFSEGLYVLIKGRVLPSGDTTMIPLN